MTRTCCVSSVVFAGLILSAQLGAQGQAGEWTKHDLRLDQKARADFIHRAQLWSPMDISSLDLRAGPEGHDAFEPNQVVTCEYVERKLHGSSPKFACAIAPGDVVKIRYGIHNREVQASVLATRLLWALGFAADRVYPVQVRCRGCSSDPWNRPDRVRDEHLFAPAVIEERPDGLEMNDEHGKAGWNWSELDLVDESLGGAPPAQRDALKLLAAFMQHTDTKREQQRLLCLSGGLVAAGQCGKPFLLLHDVGLTFGHANAFNAAGSASVDLDSWARTPVWKDADACVGHLSKSLTGTLENPRISEAGRLFLANLLEQLSDQQLYDLFEVAGVERDRDSESASADRRISQWVAAFKHKRNEIALACCPR
jgi:hypothetical protein